MNFLCCGKQKLLQSLGQDLHFGSDHHHLRDVQSRDAEGFSKAKFAVRLRVGITRRAQSHILSVKDPHTLNALYASAVKGHLGDDDGSLGINLVFAHGAPFFIQGALFSFFFQPFPFFLPVTTQ